MFVSFKNRQSTIRRLLDAQALMDAALSRAGRGYFQNEAFMDPLRSLVLSLREEANLNRFGLWAARFDISRSLNNLLWMDAAEEADPSIAHRPIIRPTFITGLPRSSSTFLHTLLAQDPGNRVPRCWQLIYPGSSRLPAGAVNFRKAQVALQLQLFQCITPALRKLHPLSADAAQECTDITSQIFQSMRYEFMYHVPAYQGWLAAHGHGDAMRFHRRFLQHMQAGAGGSWFLKSPDHVFSLDAITDVYPDAEIIFMHRDPGAVLQSCTKLVGALRRTFSNVVDQDEVRRFVTARLVGNTRNMLAAIAQPRGGRILHLHYENVVSDPIGTVRAIYRHQDRRLEPEAEILMRRFLARIGLARRARTKSTVPHGDWPGAEFHPYTESLASLGLPA